MARKTRKNPLPRTPETPAHVRAASRGREPGEQSSLFKLQQMVREREHREFDPYKRGTWRGSSKDIVVNPMGGIRTRKDVARALSDGGADRRLHNGNDWSGAVGPYKVWIGAPEGSRTRSFDIDVRSSDNRSVVDKTKKFSAVASKVYNAMVRLRGKGLDENKKLRRNGKVELHAQPYGDGPGFYFDSYEDYEKKYDQNFKKHHIEEYELQFIDGDSSDAKLFDAMGVNQATIERYFEVLDELADHEKVAVWFLLDRRITDDVDEAIKKAEDVMLHEGTAEDYVHELLDEGIIGEDAMARYFDYDAFGHDIRMDFNEEEDEATEGLSDKEVGEWYIDQTGEDQMVEIVKGNSYYFDTKAFARDLDYNSEVEEFTFDGTTYTVTNMLGL